MRPIENPHRGRGPRRKPQQTLATCSAPYASNPRHGHVGHGAAVGATGAVSEAATPDGAKQTTTAFVK